MPQAPPPPASAHLEQVIRRHQLSAARPVEQAVDLWQWHHAPRPFELLLQHIGQLAGQLHVVARACGGEG
jgi:hypothetical protein